MGYDDFDGGEGYVDGERSSSSAAAAGSHGAGAYGDEEKDPAVDDNTYVFEVSCSSMRLGTSRVFFWSLYVEVRCLFKVS